MRIEQLSGVAVVSVQQAEKLGRIEDAFVDLQKHCIGGLLLQGGLFRGGPVVPWSDVRSVGQDAVMVAEGGASGEGTIEGLGTRMKTLRGTKVVTSTGDLAGTISEADFDPATGLITSYEITAPDGGGFFHSAPRFSLSPRAFVGVGAELITVDARIVEEERTAG